MSRFLFSTVMIVLVSQVLGRSLLDASIEKREDDEKRAEPESKTSDIQVTGSCTRCSLGCPPGQEIRECTEEDFKNNRVICECTPISGSKRDALLNEV